MSSKEPNKAKQLFLLIKKLGFQGFIIPHTDEFQGEYVSENNMRLQWLTGFSGSAGTAIILHGHIHLFVDGRYTIQANQQVDQNLVTIHHQNTSPYLWLAENVKPGLNIGYDSRVHSISNIARLNKLLVGKKVNCKATEQNPIDSLWRDRPSPPFSKVNHHDLEYTGRASDEKIKAIAKEIKLYGASAIVLNELDSIAWTFNIRGNDTKYTPLMQGYAIIKSDSSAELFANTNKFSQHTRASLSSNTTLIDIANFPNSLDKLGKKQIIVGLDRDSSTEWINERLKKAGANITYFTDPSKLQRARKNKVEIKGAQAAHNRDAIAMIRFLKWFDENALTKRLTELDVVKKIFALRSEGDLFRGLSFPTIAGVGSNGAIVHYIPSETTNQLLKKGTLLLLDSGGQYLDGTTDITRTLSIGKPSKKMCYHFTLVLKGHIALASAHFPVGTNGSQLDALARQHLWRENLNYAHGTGHGVGSYLGVHEGPHRLSSGGMVPIEAGMIISNEPGQYLEGEFGIRIENLLVVIKSKNPSFLEFETLTQVPIDRRLIDVGELNNQELDWLNRYHKKVFDNAKGKLDHETVSWLSQMCAPLQ